MPRDILSEYGKDSSQPQAARATTGGVKEAKPISNYCPPQGPSNINDPKGPGIHGTSHGMARNPVGSSSSGGPGLGGTVHRSGSQRG
jgi:hypothetical protein